jgi:hypothetical protein
MKYLTTAIPPHERGPKFSPRYPRPVVRAASIFAREENQKRTLLVGIQAGKKPMRIEISAKE